MSRAAWKEGRRSGGSVGPPRLAGLRGAFPADAGRARGPGAATVRCVVGVAGDDPHALDRHAESGGCDLCEHGLGALALLGDAALADHRALRGEPYGDAALRGGFCPADAAEGRARIGLVDEGGKADAAMDALCAEPLM